MDLALRTDTLGSGDQSWLGSSHGTDAGTPCTLDQSAFTEGTHFPDGYLLSGLPLGKITSSGKYGPYTAAGAGSLTDATAEQLDFDFDDATTTTWEIGGEQVTFTSANTAAQMETAILALATFSDLTGADITSSKPTATTLRLVFPAGREVPNPVYVSATGGSTPSPAVVVTTEGAPAEDATSGLETLAGFLFCDVAVPASGADPIGALLDHCIVVEANLPVAIDDAAKADLPTVTYR